MLARLVRALAWTAALSLLPAGLSSQNANPTAASRTDARDPYVKGDPARMAAAGYVSYGPFPLGERHDTRAVEALLGGEPLLWIETKHFRIGAALSPFPITGDSDGTRKLRAELARLHQRLPTVKPATKTLDPWLRAHLIAQRAEESYAEFCELLKVTPATFPQSARRLDEVSLDEFHGFGPYLGQREKFTILIFRKTASLARYTKAYQGREVTYPIRHHDHAFDAATFAVAEESSRALFTDDTALHTHLVYNLTHLFHTSYRAYGHEIPAWYATGLAHWNARRVSPRFPAYDQRADGEGETRSFWQWEKRAPGLLRKRAFLPVEELTEILDVTRFGFEQHIQCWAFVDFLMATRRDAFVAFVHGMKDPFHARRRFPTPAELHERQRQLALTCFAVDFAGLESAWREHLQKGERR